MTFRTVKQQCERSRSSQSGYSEVCLKFETLHLHVCPADNFSTPQNDPRTSLHFPFCGRTAVASAFKTFSKSNLLDQSFQAVLKLLKAFSMRIEISSYTVVSVLNQPIHAHDAVVIRNKLTFYIRSVFCLVTRICIQKRRENEAKKICILIVRRMHATLFEWIYV